MLVSVILDKPHTHFTNLDVISGKVYLRVPTGGSITSITVKLEGESRTRLLAPARPGSNEKPKTQLEVHKLLYKVRTVFPPAKLQENSSQSSTFTLNAGQYEYPFEFKIPINNSCTASNNPSSTVNFAGISLDIAKTPYRHVKRTLPPSLTGFPGEAEIKYYVKVTVNRPQLFKENPRAFTGFNFLPIEPPRPKTSKGEVYARREPIFRPQPSSGAVRQQSRSFFGGMSDTPAVPESSERDLEPPRFSVDARLPEPAIITCNEDLPLRILIKQLTRRTELLHLQSLQIELIGYTRIRTQEIQRMESNSWIIISTSDMGIPIGQPSDAPNTETVINERCWRRRPLPNTVAPSFETCNITRFYELEVRVGLAYGKLKRGKNQLVVLPLRLEVKVFSGIAPPAALLAAMHGAPPKPPRPIQRPDLLSIPQASSSQMAPTLIEPNSPYNLTMPQQGTFLAHEADQTDEAPPSYEDAIAEDLPPIDGPRRDYAPPPPAQQDAPTSSDDQKRDP